MDEIADLKERLRKCNAVIQQLPESEAFNILVNDLEESKNQIDSSWHFIEHTTEEGLKRLAEMRVTKLAISNIINIISQYKDEADRISIEIDNIEKKTQRSYYEDEEK